MTLTNTPLQLYKEMTFVGRGTAVRKGAGPRSLLINHDLIEFQISSPLSHSPLLKKSSATGGIQLGDDGSYTITIAASEMTRALFPNKTYEYSVIITEGDTGYKFPLRKGPLNFETIALPS